MLRQAEGKTGEREGNECAAVAADLKAMSSASTRSAQSALMSEHEKILEHCLQKPYRLQKLLDQLMTLSSSRS